jgi:hypothetical protein
MFLLRPPSARRKCSAFFLLRNASLSARRVCCFILPAATVEVGPLVGHTETIYSTRFDEGRGNEYP